MRVLVTGATGFIGRHLVVALLKRGDVVYCITRNPKQEEVLKKVGAVVIRADVTDKKSLEKILDYEIDVAFHLAGIMGAVNIKNDVYWKVNVEGTRNFLTILSHRKIRTIHISSTLVIGRVGRFPANEETRVYPSNIYGVTKYEGEKIARGFAHVGMPVTIVRPEFVYGPHDMHLLPLFRTVRDRRFVFIGKGKNYVQPTYIDDLIDGLLLCLCKSDSIGKTYILAGQKYVTMREFVAEVAAGLNVSCPKLSINPSLAKFLGLSFEFLSKVWPFDPPLTRSRVKFFLQNHFFDISKAKKELGYSPKVGLSEGIASTVKWYKENKLL